MRRLASVGRAACHVQLNSELVETELERAGFAEQCGVPGAEGAAAPDQPRFQQAARRRLLLAHQNAQILIELGLQAGVRLRGGCGQHGAADECGPDSHRHSLVLLRLEVEARLEC